MSRRTNPIIFRVPHSYTQKFKYIEKKPLESHLQVHKKLETENFVKQFFNNYGLLVHDLRLCFFNNKLDVFVSYFSSIKTDSILVNEINEHRKYKVSKKVKRNKKRQLVKNINSSKKKLNGYYDLIETKTLQHSRKLELVKDSNHYDAYLLDNHKNLANLKLDYFLHQFFESLSLFTKRQINIALTLKQLNNTAKYNLTKSESQLLTKNLVKLRRYQDNEFFKEGIHILFLSTINKHSAHLLANFIAATLSKLKRHNLFLRFLKAGLSLFYNKSFSVAKGLKIRISGRFNGAPRARSRDIKVGNIPVLKISSKIDYHEATSFTSNGTFGVKVFICEKTH